MVREEGSFIGFLPCELRKIYRMGGGKVQLPRKKFGCSLINN